MRTFKDTYRFDMVPTINRGFGFGNEKIEYPKFESMGRDWTESITQRERTPLHIPKHHGAESPPQIH